MPPGRTRALPTEFEWEAASPLISHGQVWEWTRSAYDPYPGFKPFDGVAAEYNGEVHGGADGAARRLVRHPARPYPFDLSKLLLRRYGAVPWQFSWRIRLAEDL